MELPNNFWENEEFLRVVKDEVKNQMQPIILTVEAIKKQNDEQSTILKERNHWFEDFDTWRKGLWGNGSGKPGYLEKARAADDGRYERLFKEVSALKTNGYIVEGRAEGRAEVIKENADARKDRREKIRFWLAILGALAGAGVLDWVKPIILHWLQVPGK
jgi:hypothetical protein